MNNGVTSCRLHCVVAWIPNAVGVSNVHSLTVVTAKGHTKKAEKKKKTAAKNKKQINTSEMNYSPKPQWGELLDAVLTDHPASSRAITQQT